MTTLAQEAARLAAFRRCLATVRPGRVLSVNTLRTELSAAGLDDSSLGALFGAAARRGWITPTGTVVASMEASARGRLVRQYRRGSLRAAS